MAFVVWSVKVGDGQTDGRTDGHSYYKSFHFLRYKHSVEAKKEAQNQGAEYVRSSDPRSGETFAIVGNFSMIDNIHKDTGRFQFLNN